MFVGHVTCWLGHVTCLLKVCVLCVCVHVCVCMCILGVCAGLFHLHSFCEGNYCS